MDMLKITEKLCRLLEDRDGDQLKACLFPKVIGVEGNEEFLDSVPHMRMLDIAMTYRILLGESENGIISVVIDNTMLQTLDLTLKQLHKAALVNGVRIFPASFCGIMNVVGGAGWFGEIVFDEHFKWSNDRAVEFMKDQIGMYMLTNKKRLNGASSLFYPGLLAWLYQILGGNYYVLPSSIHEVMIIQESWETPTADQLKQLVCDMNESLLPEEEILSTSVYYYDGDHLSFA